MTPLFGFLGGLGYGELMVILVLGVLLFGKRLPEVGRYLGKGIVEFKKGIKGLEDDIEGTAPTRQEPAALEQPRAPQRVAATTPKFEDMPNNLTPPPKS